MRLTAQFGHLVVLISVDSQLHVYVDIGDKDLMRCFVALANRPMYQYVQTNLTKVPVQ